MPKTIVDRSTAFSTLAIFGAIAVGVWLGFSSCGGYIWHAYLAYATLALSVLAIVVLTHAGVAQRAGLALLVIGLFFVARAAGFAGYLGAGSPGEFLRQMGAAFSSGLC